MTIEIVKRTDHFQGSDKEFIAFRPQHIGFNARFCKLANIQAGMRVTYFVDVQDRKLYFKFHNNEQDPDSFSISNESAATVGSKRKSCQAGCVGLYKSAPWLKAITKLPTKQRRFAPKEVTTSLGKLWVISIGPTFEIRKSRDTDKIPSDAKGIYRYLRNGEVVYYGIGNILSRLQAEREHWDFDIIEYSIIDDPDERVKWEDVWIERHKRENDGKMPLWNKQSGCSKFREEG